MEEPEDEEGGAEARGAGDPARYLSPGWGSASEGGAEPRAQVGAARSPGGSRRPRVLAGAELGSHNSAGTAGRRPGRAPGRPAESGSGSGRPSVLESAFRESLPRLPGLAAGI